MQKDEMSEIILPMLCCKNILRNKLPLPVVQQQSHARNRATRSRNVQKGLAIGATTATRPATMSGPAPIAKNWVTLKCVYRSRRESEKILRQGSTILNGLANWMRNVKKSVCYYCIDRIVMFHNIHHELLILYIIWMLDRFIMFHWWLYCLWHSIMII